MLIVLIETHRNRRSRISYTMISSTNKLGMMDMSQCKIVVARAHILQTVRVNTADNVF